MKRLILVSFLVLSMFNRCVASYTNTAIMIESLDSMSELTERIQKDEEMIMIDLSLNPGEIMVGSGTVYTHVDSNRIYSYHYQLIHKGLSYETYISFCREESRFSGGSLFSGEYIDEELIYDGLTIRTRLTAPSKINEVLVFQADFYFMIDQIGYYGSIRHVNEIEENFDKQAIIDYIIELYEQNTD